MKREVYPTDVSDEEWAFVAPYLTLLREDAAQRVHPLRDGVDALRKDGQSRGCAWRMLPGDFAPWPAVQPQGKRRLAAGCFEALAHDLRERLRLLLGRQPQPSAGVLDGRNPAKHARERCASR